MWRSPQAAADDEAPASRLAWLGFTLALCAGAGLVLQWLVAAPPDTSGARPPETHVGALTSLSDAHERIATEIAGQAPGTLNVVFLADSTALAGSVAKPLVPPLVEARLRQQLAPHKLHVHMLVKPGLGAFAYLMLADRIVELEPDLVIVSANVANYSRISRTNFSRPAVAGLTRWKRLPTLAGLPIAWEKLTFDQVLKNLAIEGLGLSHAWDALATRQVALTKLRARVEHWLHGGPGPEAAYQRVRGLQVMSQKHAGPAPELTRRLYGALTAGVRADHPVNRALRATLEIFDEGDVPVLAFLTPLDVERLRGLGAIEEEGLAQTVASVAASARGTGAHYLDLHALLEASEFRDNAGHYSRERGGPHLAAVLARSAGEILRARPPEPPR